MSQQNDAAEFDPFLPSPPPPSSQPNNNFESGGKQEVLVEYSFRDFERFISITPKDLISYQSGRKGFYDILYDKKTPCGEIYDDMMSYVNNLSAEKGIGVSVEDIKDSVIRKTFIECIDFHSHLYEQRAQNLVKHIEGASK